MSEEFQASQLLGQLCFKHVFILKESGTGQGNYENVNKGRFCFEPISEFVYIWKIDQSHYVI